MLRKIVFIHNQTSKMILFRSTASEITYYNNILINYNNIEDRILIIKTVA